jgi:chaperonin cofactor prefoldin
LEYNLFGFRKNNGKPMTDENQKNIREILENSGNIEKELEDAKKALEESEKYDWMADEIKKLGL